MFVYQGHRVKVKVNSKVKINFKVNGITFHQLELLTSFLVYRYFSLVGHFQNEVGHFWPAGMGLDGPVLAQCVQKL